MNLDKHIQPTSEILGCETSVQRMLVCIITMTYTMVALQVLENVILALRMYSLKYLLEKNVA